MTNEESNAGDAIKAPEAISGTAKNAKAGAVLVADDGNPTYVEGLSEWPDHLKNKRLRLVGVVERKTIFPAVQEVEGGEIQGMVGVPRVIRLPEPLPESD